MADLASMPAPEKVTLMSNIIVSLKNSIAEEYAGTPVPEQALQLIDEIAGSLGALQELLGASEDASQSQVEPQTPQTPSPAGAAPPQPPQQ